MSEPVAPVTPMPKPDGGAPVTPPQAGGRRTWMAHVKATMRAHPGLSLKQALRKAKLTYKKSKRGGGVLTPSPVGAQAGGRHRRGHKTRRGRRGGNLKLY